MIAEAQLFLLLPVPLWLACARVSLLTQCAESFGLLVLVTLVSYWTVRMLRRKVFLRLVDGNGKAVLITGEAQRNLLSGAAVPTRAPKFRFRELVFDWCVSRAPYATTLIPKWRRKKRKKSPKCQAV